MRPEEVAGYRWLALIHIRFTKQRLLRFKAVTSAQEFGFND